MSHVTEYQGFCKRVASLRAIELRPVNLFKKIAGLHDAIKVVAEAQGRAGNGASLIQLAQHAEQVRKSAISTPGLKPLHLPDCLGILAKAPFQAALATDISVQLLPTVLAFPAL